MLSRIHCLLALLACTAALAAQPVVTSLTPPRHDGDAAAATNISAGFSTPMGSPGANTFRVRSNLRGWLAGSVGAAGSTLTFNPTANLLSGEEIEAVLTTGVQSSGGQAIAAAQLWRFRAATNSGPGTFDQNVHATGTTSGWDVEFGDLDGDGDLDMVIVTNGQNSVHLNDGHGVFSSAALGQGDGSYACELADVDDDADLDVIVANAPVSTQAGQLSGQDRIWLNDGSGAFSSSTTLGSSTSYTIDCDVGDLDGDGDVDIVMANGGISAEANDLWINNGSGGFTRRAFYWTSSSTAEYTDNCWSVRLSDADNDGDLDVFTGNFDFGPTQSYLFLNDGAANFYWMNALSLGAPAIALDMAVADFNADGWVDVAFGLLGQSASGSYNRVAVYFNNGSGGYGSATTLGAGGIPYGLEAADVDGDGDLDLGVGIDYGQSYIMQNPGNGQFASTSALGPANATAYALSFADIDGDGDLDAATPDNLCVNGYRAPYLTVTSNGSPITNGGTLNVNWNSTLAALGLAIIVNDPDGRPASVAAGITNGPTQGFQVTEFGSGTAGTPYTLNPTSGTFNQGSVTHTVTLTANNGYVTGALSFDIIVGAAPNSAPSIAVTTTAGSVANGSSVNVAFGTSLASLGLQITVDDADGGSVALAGSVSNSAGTGILNSQFSSAAQAVAYSLAPSSGSFNQAGLTHTVSLTANDGNGGVASSNFTIVVGAQPTPAMAVRESTATGTPIAPGAAASGGRDFGSQDVASGATAALTIVIVNAGAGTLSVTGVSLGGADAGSFVLNTAGLAATIAPGANDTFQVAFDPASAGGKSATISISHNDASQPAPYTFEIAGVGTTPAPVPLVVVSENGSFIANGAAPSGGRNFGTQDTGSASAPVVITITNAGNGDLQLGTPVASSPEFSLNLAGLSSTLLAGQSISFTIVFAPLTDGTLNGTVSFSHNDNSTATPFSFDVTGTAVTPATGSGSGGSTGGGGGGCAAESGTSLAVLLMACLLGAWAAASRRRKSA